MNSTHREVIELMGESAAQGEVTLRIRRKVLPADSSFLTNTTMSNNSYTQQNPPQPTSVPQTRPPPRGEREVVIERPTRDQSFGFVLQSNLHKKGCSISEFSAQQWLVCVLIPVHLAVLSTSCFIPEFYLCQLHTFDLSILFSPSINFSSRLYFLLPPFLSLFLSTFFDVHTFVSRSSGARKSCCNQWPAVQRGHVARGQLPGCVQHGTQ